MQLKFDDATHVYRWHGSPIPSVTQTLEAAGLVDWSRHTIADANRGIWVHMLCKLDDLGRLTTDMLARYPAYLGYVDSWRRWTDIYQPVWTDIEEPFSAVIHGIRYAGTIDRRGWIGGRRVVADLKSGPIAPWHELQIAAYEYAQASPHKRLLVRLYPNGRTATMHEVTEPNAAATFAAALLLNQWKGMQCLNKSC